MQIHQPSVLNITKVKCLQIRARLYAALSNKPSYTTVETRESGTNRFPLLEGILADLHTQPFIHDYPITVYESNCAHTFRVFCKNHCHLPVNKAIREMGPDLCWKGDIMVLRSGKKHGVVNMRSRDAALADFVVKRWASPDCC